MPRGSMAAITFRAAATTPGSAPGAKAEGRKPSAKAPEPSASAFRAPAARFTLASFPSAALFVSASTRACTREGSRSANRSAV